MVDYLIKTEQRALMGSYHASWAPFCDGDATVQWSIVFDILQALLLITIFHQIVFTASTLRPMMPSGIAYVYVYSLVTMIKYKLVQDYF